MSHSMARANLNKSNKNKTKNYYSKKAYSLVDHIQQKLKSRLSDFTSFFKKLFPMKQILLQMLTFTDTFTKFCSEGGISIDADSGSPKVQIISELNAKKLL